MLLFNYRPIERCAVEQRTDRETTEQRPPAPSHSTQLICL